MLWIILYTEWYTGQYRTGVQNTHYTLQSTIWIQYIVLTDTLQYGNIAMWCFLSLIDKTHANEGRCQQNCGNVHEIRKEYILRCASQSESLIRLWKFPKLKRKVMRVKYHDNYSLVPRKFKCAQMKRGNELWYARATELCTQLNAGAQPSEMSDAKKFTSLMHWLSFPTSKGVE